MTILFPPLNLDLRPPPPPPPPQVTTRIMRRLWVCSLCVLARFCALAGAGLLQETSRGVLDSALDPVKQLAFNFTNWNESSQRTGSNPLSGLNQDFAAGLVELSEHSVTGLLPVTADSIIHLQEILGTFFEGLATIVIQDVILVTPRYLAPRVLRSLEEILTAHSNVPQPRFSVREREYDMRDGSAYVITATDISTPWLLAMDWDGLKGLDEDIKLLLLRTGHTFLPIGPLGEAMNVNVTGDAAVSLPGRPSSICTSLAAYVKPPFVVSRALIPGEDGSFRNWEIFGRYFGQCNSLGVGGIVIKSTASCNIDNSDRNGRLNMEDAAEIQAVISNPREDNRKKPVRFTFLFSSSLNVQHVSPLVCQLISDGHRVHLLVVETNMKYSFNPIRRKARLILDPSCKLEFFTVNQFMHRREIVTCLGDVETDVVVVALQEGRELNGHFVKHFVTEDNVIVRLPVEDLPYCDWMASLSLEEWANWNKPRIDISIITRDRPQSLQRLLNSIVETRYFGDGVNVRINLEQDCDDETLELSRGFGKQWAHGSVFLHHRIIHAGLLPAVVESWYPSDSDSYGLLLEDDVEVSPLFYAWVKKSILKYRYGMNTDISPNLFGISLYQQKHIELRLGGRAPFNARTHFASQGYSHPSTPYLSQVPCSWGAVYFPEFWREFHQYLALRFAESWLPIDEIVVPNVRSNNWSKSWKKFFIELAFLKGYVMLYPNFDGFASLSTNHLELGSHVKVRSRKKQEMFELPLMSLPSAGVGGSSMSVTGLSELPGGGLPSFRDLPVLNLTAAISSMEDIEAVGRARQEALCGTGTKTLGQHIHNFICALNTSYTVP